MSAALELIQIVESAGGRFMVDGDRLGIVPREAALAVLNELRQHKAEIIGLLESASIPAGATAKWRKPFAKWLDSACVRDPRCSGGVGCLHVAFCEWAIAQDDVPCKRFTFECLLRESGLSIDEIAGVVLVSGLTFREDSEAVGFRPGAGGNSPSARK